MDFNDTPEQAKFRKEVQDWLQANAIPIRYPRELFYPELPESERLQLAQTWQHKKAESGFAAITWPKEYGGRGGSQIEKVIYSQEEANYCVPFGFFEISLGMCIPTLMSYGSSEEKDRYVKPALYGDEIWVQMFSEPSAGSDLAGIRTKAVKEDDDWIINGQKVWTTCAQFADYGIVLTRTNPDAPKHKGLTMFYIDMKSPGVEVRPIVQMNGQSEFNEVFFTDVKIPDSQRLGDIDNGWNVALTTLMFERLTVGSDIGLIDYQALFELSKRVIFHNGEPAIENPAVRSRIADSYLKGEGLRLHLCRAITALSAGQTPGPEQSLVKLVSALEAQNLAEYAMDLMGEMALMSSKELGDNWKAIEHSWTMSAAMRIAGGTDEVLKNIISERILGLPGEIRNDKNIPFNQIPQ